ncbi:MAG: PrsW family intramembrane metalloprotease [Candidatus Bipolaricaulota bacterium]|nr:PrsW family intramembrane metalloprotease [Candidatus Bipolaricaulota bacterium]
MMVWLAVLAFSPAIFWLWYVYQKDRWEPEPRALVVKTFLLGMACALPAALLEIPFAWSEFFLIVVAAPVIEEYAKYFVVSRTVYRQIDFNEPMDGIVYSAAAALGFASIENLLYLLAAQHQDLLAPVFIGRALFSVPGHVLFSTIWGAALGRAKFVSDPLRQRALIHGGLLMAMTAHALFNLLAMFELLGAIGLLVFLFFAWKLFHQRVEEALSQSPYVQRLEQLFERRDDAEPRP